MLTTIAKVVRGRMPGVFEEQEGLCGQKRVSEGSV